MSARFITAFLLCLAVSAPLAARADGATLGQQKAQIRAEENDAIQQVVKIVNQPVTHLKMNYTPGMVSTFSPGWFHPGAVTPDFNKVDVRTTQQFPYAGNNYVTSDINPGEMFAASELEFNPMTKYFYTDRSLPKKKLTEAEMMEINRLYRIIGADEKKLEDLKNPPAPLATDGGLFNPRTALIALAILLAAVGALVFGKKKSA